jgi:membrane dipeptidase
MTARKSRIVVRQGYAPSDRALELLSSSVVCDLTLPWTPAMSDVDETLPRFKAAGYSFLSMTAQSTPPTLPQLIHWMADVRAHIASRPDYMIFVRTVEDIRRAVAQDKLAIGFNIQDTIQLEGSTNLVRTYYDLGVRHMLLAYNTKNLVGDGCSERTDAGLSRFGIAAIEEMNRIGMLVDGSHTGYRTTMEAMEVTRAPFIFSHCCCAALAYHYRNVRDDQIKACAATGGVIGIAAIGAFLGDITAQAAAQFRHIDHVAQLVGPEHVAIGNDYVKDMPKVWAWARSNPQAWPEEDSRIVLDGECTQPEQLVELVELMLERGYSEGNVRGVLGENYLRVAAGVWQ